MTTKKIINLTTLLKVNLFAGLLLVSGFSFGAFTGNYTVNAAGTATATNYKTFASLFSDLSVGTRADGGTANGAGVTGPVIIDVTAASGPYTEQITVKQITGISATNKIVINGNGNIIQFSATVSTAQHTILFDGADYVTFDNFTILANGATYGRCFHLMNSADYNTISNCTLQMPNMTASITNGTAYVAITQGTASMSTYGIAGGNNTITKCKMSSRANGGPYAGIAVIDEATLTTIVRPTTITNNTIRDFGYAGIYGYQTHANVISGNEIFNTGNTYNSYTYGIYFTTTATSTTAKGGDHTITYNYIHDLNLVNSTSYYQYGIYQYAYYGNGTNALNISFNKIVLNCNYYCYGIYAYGYYSIIKNAYICSNNTVDMQQTTTTNSGYLYGIYSYGNYYGNFTSSELNNNMIRIRTPFYSYGMYAYNYNGTAVTKRGSISNNILDYEASLGGYAMILYAYDQYNAQPTDISYNTIYSSPAPGGTSSGTKYLFYPYYCYGKIHNNIIFSKDNGGTTNGVYDYYYGGTYSNNNIYNAGLGNTFNIYKNGTIVGSDLASYKTNFGDVNGMWIDPIFKNIATQDYKPSSFSFVNKGIPVTGITLDNAGVTRNTTTPDVGALEFYVDVAFNRLYFKGKNVCGGYKEPVKITLANKTTDAMVNVPVMYTVTGKAPVYEIVPSIKANDTIQYTFNTIAEFNGSGASTLTVKLNGSDDDLTNNSLTTSLNITAAPFGFQLIESTTFPGYFRPGINGGVKTNPDATIPGKKVIYEIQPPTGYTNAGATGYGSLWYINPNFRTVNGTIVSGPVYKAPSGSSNGTIEFDPSSTYIDSLIYINLSVINLNTGCDSSFGRYIYIPHTPTASFIVNDVCMGEAAVFTNKATLAKGTAVYVWKFNDPGNPEDTSRITDPAFTFSNYGTYTVTLTSFRFEYPKFVTTYSKSVVVTAVPTIDFKVFNACEREFVKFTNNTTIPVSGAITYDWDFGDPSSTTDKSTAKEPQWKYSNAGGYKVSLKATANGCSSALVKNANQFSTPVAKYTVPSTLCDKTEIKFTNSSTISIGNMGYVWSFGDGTISGETNANHTFATSGTKAVKMKVISEFGCKDSITKAFTLSESPMADFKTGSICNLTATDFVFTGTKPSGALTSFNWDFAGEGTTTVENPSKLFSVTGTKLITLTLTSNNGCSDVLSKEIEVKLQSKSAFDVADVCDGNEAVFTNRSVISSGNLLYTWKFGDGKNSISQSPRHLYTSGTSQTYNVTLVAVVPGGCSDSITKPVTVNANPVSNFTFNTSGRLVYYNPTQTGNTKYHWNFGEGGTAENANTQYHYLNSFATNKFTVCLSVTNASGCLTKTCKEVAITSGIEKLEKLTGVTLYPNPNKGNFTVTVENPKSDISMAVYNLLGEEIKVIETNSLKSNYSVDLNVANGIYIVKITNGGLTSSQKITINK